MTIAGVVLGAGEGTRFEGPTHKLLADFGGDPVAACAIRSAVVAGFNQLFVVSGCIDLEAELATRGSEFSQGITWLHAPRWAEGQAHSLQTAIKAADAAGHDAIVVGLADQPLVPASAWRSVGASRGAITVAEFAGERRPPVKLEREVWPLLPTEGDLGAREVMRQHPELVGAVPCAGNAADIDTKRDLTRWS